MKLALNSSQILTYQYFYYTASYMSFDYQRVCLYHRSNIDKLHPKREYYMHNFLF